MRHGVKLPQGIIQFSYESASTHFCTFSMFAALPLDIDSGSQLRFLILIGIDNDLIMECLCWRSSHIIRCLHK